MMAWTRRPCLLPLIFCHRNLITGRRRAFGRVPCVSLTRRLPVGKGRNVDFQYSSTSSSSLSLSSSALHSRSDAAAGLSAEEAEDPSRAMDVNRADSTNSNATRRLLLDLLTSEQRHLLEQQKDLTRRSRDLARKVRVGGIGSGDADEVEEEQPFDLLDDCSTFSVVVAGEYNAGKSTLINALLGRKLLETGSVPTTDCVAILSSQPPPPTLQAHRSVVQYLQIEDIPLLKDLTLVDTPGTNAVLVNHTIQTLRILPSADWILFVTSADRPFTESERTLLESMAHSYRKSIAIVINKMDILEQSGGIYGQEEKRKVVDFVTEHARTLLGAQPVVIPVSSRDALASNHALSPLFVRSNFHALQTFLSETLTTATKLQSKLVNPLGSAEHSLRGCLDRLHREKRSFEEDYSTLQLLSSQLAGWKRELESEMNHVRKQTLEYTTQRQGNRGYIFLNRIGLLGYLQSISSTVALRSEWDRTAPLGSGLAKTDLVAMMEEAASSIATQGRAHGQSVIEFLGHRSSASNTKGYSLQSLVGRVTAVSRFEETRIRLCEQLMQAVDRAIAKESDNEGEGDGTTFLQWISRSVRAATILNMMAVASFVGNSPIAGLAAACTGMACVAFGRRTAAQWYADQWMMRGRVLDDDVQRILDLELERIDRRIREGVSPYTRFVEAEQSRLKTLIRETEDTIAELERLRNTIRQLR